ncbi:MAG: aldose 1-epimerase family protein [Oscillospiraceae bacterium]|nr:aldose 1-epimerase family protein [Oscillospiraceae bacterium]
MEKMMKSGYVNHPQQLYTLRRVTVNEGKAKGTEIIEVCTAGGLQVDILPDAGMDIGQVRYKGVNVTFISKNGYDSPAAIMPYEGEFLNTFPGGLLYTSGLRTTGGAHRDGDEWQPFHGRHHSHLAEQICTEVVDDTVVIRGTVRETALFGHHLMLKRIIRIPVFGAQITVEDEMTNLTHSDQEYAILYHCNFGYPFISADARVELPEKRRTSPRNEFSATGIGTESGFPEPTPGAGEMVFFHEDMKRTAAVVNEKLGIRMDMLWSETLPIMAQWRSTASGDYALGLEPTNCYILGRKAEREHGTLKVLKPFESVKTGVTIGFVDI